MNRSGASEESSVPKQELGNECAERLAGSLGTRCGDNRRLGTRVSELAGDWKRELD